MSHATVLCGVAGVEEGIEPLRVADALARGLGLRLVALHAVLPPVGVPAVASGVMVPAPAPTERDDLASDADALLRAALERAGVEAEHRAVEGDAVQALLTAADEHAELLVVGSRGRGPIGAALLGSVSAAVAADAPVPTVVVPEGAADGLTGGGAILCFVENIDTADAPVSTAAALAERLGRPLTLVHAGPPPHAPGSSASPGAHERLGAAESHEAARFVDEIAERHGVGGDVAGRTILGRGAGPLRELAVEERAALLVVGTRGHGALRSAVEGSVSGELAADAPCPVVVARAPYGRRQS